MLYKRKAIRIINFFLCLIIVTSCQRASTHIPQSYTQPINHPDKKSVKIKVLDEPEFNKEYIIDNAGMILMPYIGKVQIDDRTATEIEQDIITRLKDGYILDPTVSVQKTSINTFYIIGAVKNPGRHIIPDDAQLLLNAIAIAGGYTADADKKSVELIRKKHGKVQHHKNASTLSPLRARDTIIVRGGGF